MCFPGCSDFLALQALVEDVHVRFMASHLARSSEVLVQLPLELMPHLCRHDVHSKGLHTAVVALQVVALLGRNAALFGAGERKRLLERLLQVAGLGLLE